MSHSLRRLAVTVGCAMLLALPTAAMAEDQKPKVCPICGRTNAGYSSKAGTTLVRGAANTLLGWTELIRQPAQEAKAGGNVLVGIGKGIGHGVMRTLAGVGEVFTFWTPKVNNKYIHFADDCPVCMKKKPAQ